VAELPRAIEQACKGFRVARETKPFNPHFSVGRINEETRQDGLAVASANKVRESRLTTNNGGQSHSHDS
jgi:2'-5' RNA ligase